MLVFRLKLMSGPSRMNPSEWKLSALTLLSSLRPKENIRAPSGFLGILPEAEASSKTLSRGRDVDDDGELCQWFIVNRREKPL